MSKENQSLVKPEAAGVPAERSINDDVQEALLDGGIVKELVDSVRQTLKAETMAPDGITIMADNKARTETQKNLLAYFEKTGKKGGVTKNVFHGTSIFNLNNEPIEVIKFVKTHGRLPTDKERAEILGQEAVTIEATEAKDE